MHTLYNRKSRLSNHFHELNVHRIGVSEKGYVTVKLTVRADAGHSSMSPRETAIVKLAKVISRLVEHEQIL